MSNDQMTANTEGMHNVGVLYSDESGKGLMHPFFGYILDGFQQEMYAHGYDVTYIHPAYIQGDMDCLAHCRALGLSGVCLTCVDFKSPEIVALTRGGLPCVTVDHLYKGIPAVLSDNEAGMTKLLECAIFRGHRRIAFIHGQNNSVVTRTRVSQFHNTMDYYKIPVPEAYVLEGTYHDIDLTRRLVGELLRLPERPTCILLPDDLSYLGAQDAARELNMRIPEDISFAGYDGIPLTQSLSPRLTTIRQNCDVLGKSAAEKLIALIENPDTKPTASIFPVDFIEGETIGFAEDI